ncbi:MAG: type I glutamate--ammonia ligase [Planctomycetota bacterium]|nr:type I glutamate--ammonia ligase [Planctomycetota bacterium]
MFKTAQEVMKYAKKMKAGMVDLKFTDLFGHWHHLTLPAARLTERLFAEGEAFDGSSTPGFKRVEASDMALLPDPRTCVMDPFWEVPTISMICSIVEADTKAPFPRDPRLIAAKTEEHMRKLGVADAALFAPEFEYYIFDSVSYKNDVNMASYVIDSEEADWNTGLLAPKNLGHKIPRKGGYHAIPPLDSLYNVRSEAVTVIEKSGIPVRFHHHEVGGPGQSEIEIMPLPLIAAGDATMWIKYVIKNVAKKYSKTVTFMPKPLYNESGSGMHFHQHLFKGGKPLFCDKDGYAGLSKLALHYVAGLLTHGRALLGLTNPSTNSYKRLLPGFEAPVKLFFSLANRSAAVRIPKYPNSPMEKRLEFRPPDATCNPYLAMSAMLLAGIDGIRRKINPTEAGFGPLDMNVFELPPDKLKRITSLPTSLKEALDALEADHGFLLVNDIFSPEIVSIWIEHKMASEYNEVRNRPHPYEMSLYYDV